MKLMNSNKNKLNSKKKMVSFSQCQTQLKRKVGIQLYIILCVLEHSIPVTLTYELMIGWGGEGCTDKQIQTGGAWLHLKLVKLFSMNNFPSL